MLTLGRMFNLFKNNYSFGKGIIQAINPSLLNTNNFIYKEKIKWELNKDLIFYPYGTLRDIKLTPISKEIVPFQFVQNNKLIYSNSNDNKYKIEIFYMGMKKIEEDNTIIYEVKNNTKAYYFIVDKGNEEKRIFIYFL
jgi:hypothetical protein